MKKNLLTIISIFLAIVAIGAAYNIYLLSRPVKTIRIVIDTASPLVDVRPEASDVIQILYNGQLVDNPQLVQIELMNTGNQPIVTSDYTRPLSFSFESRDEIVNVSVVNSHPSNVDLVVNKSGAYQAIASPALLNPGDIVTIRFIVAESGNDPIEDHFRLDARIVGVSEIGLVSRPTLERQTSTLLSTASAVVALLTAVAGFFIVVSARRTNS